MSDPFGLDLPLIHAGKVRRLYDLGDDRMLMVATDAISAFDYILDTPIPDKGAVLNQLSLWWFSQLADVMPNDVIEPSVVGGAMGDMVEERLGGLAASPDSQIPDAVRGRSMVVEKLDMLPVECVARGYLTGSGWAEYQETGSVAGHPMPEGLVDGSRLPNPIFTPAIKAEVGEHDENVDYATIARIHGEETASALRDATIDLYSAAEQIAQEHGIILADTKFEFGRRADGTLVLADEVLTPDSSRFWDAALYNPGYSLPSFDKQFVRDWLTHESGWDKASGAQPPALPASVIEATRARYIEAYERLTGETFSPRGTSENR